LSNVNIFGFVTPIETVLKKMEVELIVQAKLLRSARIEKDTPLNRIAALLNRSRRGQTYWQSFVHHQDSLQQLFAESPRLAASLKDIPLDALMDMALKAGGEPESPIPSHIGGADTGYVLSSFSSALAPFVVDAELRGHIQDLSKLITQNVGKSWNETLKDAKISSAGAS
jgi:hypothetical protein